MPGGIIDLANRAKDISSYKIDNTASQPEKWYKGSQPTSYEIYGRIGQIYNQDKAAGADFLQKYRALQNTPGNIYSNPYTTATNNAVASLASRGYDMSNIDDNWFNKYGYMSEYLSYNGTTTTPSKPGKKATQEEIDAYDIWQVGQSRKLTAETQGEWDRLQNQLRYWTNASDRNYTDDELIAKYVGTEEDGYKALKENYPNLYNMQMSMGMGTGKRLELNAPVGYSLDACRGTIWSARNGQQNINPETAIVLSAMGEGNQWQENANLRSMLDDQGEGYKPYAAGSTMETEREYFGVDSFSWDWCRQNKSRIEKSGDETAKKYYNNVVDALEYADKCQTQKDEMYEAIDKLVLLPKYQNDPQKLIDYIYNGDQYKDLLDLDETMTGDKITQLKAMPYAFDYRRQDVEDYIYGKIEAENNRTNGFQTLSNNGVSYGTEQDMELAKSTDTNTKQAIALIGDDTTPAESKVFRYSPSSMAEASATAFRINIDGGPANFLLQNEGTTMKSYTTNCIPIMADVATNVKSTRELANLNRVNNQIADRLDGIRRGYNAGDGEFAVILGIIEKGETYQNEAGIYMNNEQYRDALIDLYCIANGVDVRDDPYAYNDLNIKRNAEAYFDYIMNYQPTYEEGEEIPWLMPDYEDEKAELEAEIERTADAQDKLDQQNRLMADRIAMYDEAGLDATGLKTSMAVTNVIDYFSQYEATEWLPYGFMDTYQMANGASYEDTLEGTKENVEAAQENIENIKFVLEYAEENGIEIPEEYVKNMNRFIAYNERIVKDYEYYTLRGNEDFKEKSENGFLVHGAHIPQEYVNQQEDKEAFLKEQKEISRMQYESRRLTKGLAAAADSDDLKAIMTDDEIDTYYYLYETQGKEAAEEYFNYLSDPSYGVLHTRLTQQTTKAAEDLVNSGWLGGLLANAIAVVSAPVDAATSARYDIETIATGREFNPDNALRLSSNTSTTINEATVKSIQENIEEGPLRDIAQGAYEIGYNRGRSAVNALVMGGLTSGITSQIAKELVGAIPMAIDAGDNATAKAKRAGAQDWQAYAIGGITVLAEDLTEGLTYGNIDEALHGAKGDVARGVKDLLINWLTSSGIEEMIGESANDIIENLGDEIIFGVFGEEGQSEHDKLVNEYINKLGLDPDNPVHRQHAEDMARHDEIAGVLHTALISYLSPGLDVFTGTASDVARDYQTARLSQRQLKSEGVNTSLSDIRKEYKAWKKGAREAQENGEEYASWGDVMGEIRDVGKLDAVEDSDVSTQVAALTALFEGEEGTPEWHEANAAGVGIPQVLGGENSTSKDAVHNVKNMLIAARATGTSTADVKSAVKTAALSPSSAAATVIQGEAFQSAAPEVQARMLAETVSADQANETVAQEAAKAALENRIANEEKRLMGNDPEIQNKFAAVKAAEKKVDQAQKGLDAAKEQLEEAYRTNKANADNLGASVMAVLNAPTPEAKKAAAATYQQSRLKLVSDAISAKRIAEQNVSQSENALETAQKEFKDATQKTVAELRQKATDNVNQQIAQEQQARAEAEARAAEQAVIDEQNRVKQIAENNVLNIDTENFIEEKYKDSTEEEKQRIRETFKKAQADLNEAAQESGVTMKDIDISATELLARGKLLPKLLPALSKKFGIEVKVDDSTKPEYNKSDKTKRSIYSEGFYDPETNTLLIDEKTTVKQIMYKVLGHELTHVAEASNTYEELADALLQLNPNYGPDVTYRGILDEMKNGNPTSTLASDIRLKKEKYQNRLKKTLSDEYALQEIVADEMGKLLQGDQELVNRLAAEKPNVLRRIIDSIRSFLRKVRGLDGDWRTDAEKLVDMLENKLKEVSAIPLDQRTTPQSRYAAAQNADNVRYYIGENEEIATYVPDGTNTKTGESVDFIDMMLDGTKEGETRDHNKLTRKWTGLTKDGLVYGRVRFGNPIKITKDSPEYKVAMIKDTNFDIEDGGFKYYYPVLEKEDFRDNPIPVTPNGNYGKYQRTEAKPLVTDSEGNEVATELPGGTEYYDPNVKYSLSSFNENEQEEVRKALLAKKNQRGDKEFTKEQVDKYMEDALSIAKMIADDRQRLDFIASDNQVFLKPNNDYYFTLDASTLCAKRLLYQGTFDYVQHALPDEVFTPEDLIDLVNIMNEMGYETPCGICYVESRRRWLDTYAQKFLDELPDDADSFIDKYFKKGTAEEKAAIREGYDEWKNSTSIDNLTTSDGLEKLRHDNPYMHKAFVAAMNKKGTANPKVVQLRTEYRGDIRGMTKGEIQKVKDIGGLRIQSFSDFETPHLLDMMQAVLDMSAAGLTSQAYTKVPNFAWVFGDTGIKINLSLIGKGTGLDADGNLVFDNREGINFDEAMKLRERYGKNVGTILVGINDDHIVAAMGDPRIDFIIPFHKSGWSAEELRKMPTLNNYSDYTDTQNERVIIKRNEDGSYETESFKVHKDRTGEKLENFQPVGKNGYWVFEESGQWNAENYLKMCAKQKRIPKFSQFLVDNGDGSFSLPQGTDKRSTAIREGYWKTLIDFKMYENDSYGRTSKDGTKTEVKGAKQQEVKPNINMDQAYRVMDEYKLGRQMPDNPDGTEGKFIPMESNNSVPVAIPAAEEYIETIKRKRAGIKPEGPAPDTLEADLPEDAYASNYRPWARNAFGASMAPAVLGNTGSTAEESASAQQNAMAIDAETGETVRYSLPEDALYMAAVERGDTDYALQLLDEAAYKAGNTTGAYHGSNVTDIDVFNTHTENNKKTGWQLLFGTHFTQNPEYAKIYAKKANNSKGTSRLTNKEGRVYDVKLNLGKSLDLRTAKNYTNGEEIFELYNDLPEKIKKKVPMRSYSDADIQMGFEPGEYVNTGDMERALQEMSPKQAEAFLRDHGYNSVLYYANYGGGMVNNMYAKDPSIIMLDPERIKEFGITYDDRGNVIPLSERFNIAKPSIRYSLPSDNLLYDQVKAYLQNGGSNSTALPPGNGTDLGAYTGETGNAQRQFGRKTAQESDALHQEVKDYLYQNSSYTPDTNRAQIDRSIDWVQSHATENDPEGYYGSVDEVTRDDFDYRSADGQARMLTVMSMAALKGDIATEMRLADAYNKQGTDLGRQLQARKIFRLMTPLGRRSVLQGMVDQINSEYKKKGNRRRVQLSDWTMRAAEVAKTEDDFDKVRKAAQKELAEQMPSNWKEKLVAWRMLSMLGNIRTHVRNFVGNLSFMPAVGLKNKLAAVGENLFLEQEERTKTLGLATPEARAFAKKYVDDVKNVLTGEGKYNDKNAVQKERKIWGQGKGVISKTLGKGTQALYDFNGKALEWEDWIFLKRHFQNAMAGFMTARGLTEADMKGRTLEEATEYAMNEAQKATYRDANKVATALSNIKYAPFRFIVNAVLPFKKTPMNILRRGIEYSPFAFLKAPVDVYHLKQWNDYKHGKLDALPEKAISPSQFIDKMASGLTGTAIAGLGALLSALGAVRVSFDDDDDDFDKMRGEQEYGLNIELFGQDVSYTLDWLAPTCMPFFTGAAMYETLEKQAESEGKEVDITGMLSALLGITEPVWNLSMLEGVNNVMNSAKYAGDNPMAQMGLGIVANYFTSFVPTFSGQVARTVDTTRRKNYVPSGGNVIDQVFGSALEQVENKIPFLSKSNIPYRNAFGEEDTSSTLWAAIENFISPGYGNIVDNDDPMLNEMERLYTSLGNDSRSRSATKPKLPSKTMKAGGDTVYLNAEQYDQLTVERGQTAKNLLNELIQTPEYMMADDETKADMVSDVWTYSTQRANGIVFEGTYNQDVWVKNAEKNGNPIDAVINRAIERNKSDYKSAARDELYDDVLDGNNEAANVCVQKLRDAGSSDSSIKSSLTSHYKPIYVQAAKDLMAEDDPVIREQLYETMRSIENGLMSLDLANDYKPDDFDKWLKGIDEPEEEEEETGYDTSWLNRNQ